MQFPCSIKCIKHLALYECNLLCRQKVIRHYTLPHQPLTSENTKALLTVQSGFIFSFIIISGDKLLFMKIKYFFICIYYPKKQFIKKKCVR